MVLNILLALACAIPKGAEITIESSQELTAAVESKVQTIHLAPGTYELPTQLVLASGTRLVGAGTDQTIITHTKEWMASTESLPDPETRLEGLDQRSYLIRLEDKSVDVEISNLTLTGPQVHGAVLGISPKELNIHQVKFEDFMWSGLRTLNMRDSKVHYCEFVNAGGKWKRGGVVPEERGGTAGGAMFLTWVKDSEIAHNRFRRTISTNGRKHFGIKGRQGKRCRIHHNTIDFGFSIEFPFEGDEDMEIDHNILRGAVSIPKHAGGKIPKSGSTFHLHHNYFTTSYAIEFVRNGVEIDHNLFDFVVNQDGGNLISGFGRVAASGPAKFHNNLVKNPGRGVIWINEPYDEFEIRNNHIIARTTVTPRLEGLFSLKSKNDFKKLTIRNNIVQCIGQDRPLLRNVEMYAANVADNVLINVSDANRFEATKSDKHGPETPLSFQCGAENELTVDGWDIRPTTILNRE